VRSEVLNASRSTQETSPFRPHSQPFREVQIDVFGEHTTLSPLAVLQRLNPTAAGIRMPTAIDIETSR
jgi:hypothetical protein